MEVQAILLQSGRIEVTVQDRTMRDRILFLNSEQMMEFARLLAAEAERVSKLAGAAPSRPTALQQSLFN